MDGVTTTNLATANIAEEVLVNYQGSTRRIALSRLAELLALTGGDGSSLAAEVAARIEAVNGLAADIGKIFHSRNRAINVGQENIPSDYRVIMTVENNGFAVRFPGTQDDDPLFSTDPYWGVGFRVDVNDGRIWSVSGVLSPSGLNVNRGAGIAFCINQSTDSFSIWRNFGGPADGQEGDSVKQDANGRWWDLVFDSRGLHNSIEVALRGGVPILENIGGTGDAITAALPVALRDKGITSVSGNAIAVLIPPQVNTGPVTLFVDGDAERTLTSYAGTNLPAGYLKPGRSYLIRRINANWRVAAGDVDSADLAGAIATLAAESGANLAATQTEILMQTENAMAQTEGLGVVWPGDSNYLGRTAKPWLYFDDQGRLIANMSPLCKYTLAPDGVLLADGIGAPVVSIVEGRGRFSGDIYERAAPWPGDPLVVAYDGNGLPLVSIKPDGTYVFHAGIESPNIDGDTGGGGGGSGVEWLDAAQVDVAGNVWMAHKRGEDIHFFSEYRMRGERRTIAFVQRSFIRPDESTYTEQIAETPASALGVMAYGAGHVGHGTGLFEPYWPYIRLPDLSPAGSNSGASLRGFAALSVKDAEDAQLPLCIAITRVNPSTSLNDMQKGSADYAALMTSLGDAVNNAARWSKEMQIDRIAVSAGSTDLTLSKGAADAAYASLASDLRNDVVAGTGQGFGPKILVSQSGGTDVSGTGGLILAEAELAIVHPLSGFVVAGPRYPYPLLAGSASQLSDEGIALCTELEAEAMRVTGLGQQWYCPSLASAVLNGADIELAFSTLDHLEFDPDSDAPDYGFAVDGIDNGAVLTNIALQATPDLTNRVILTFDQAPTGDLIVRYAYGMSGEIGSGRFANRGALRDAWSKPSSILPGATLRRNALSAQMNVV